MTQPNLSDLTRRHWLLSSAAAWAWPGLGQAQAQTPAATLPLARSLPDELAAALSQGQPLTVMASLEGCVFCKIVRRSHLAPMHRQGQPVVQVDLRNPQTVRDFAGLMTTHDELTRRWRIGITPTVLFFGPHGKEVAERMEGAYQPDFYGPYLDDRLALARTRLNG